MKRKKQLRYCTDAQQSKFSEGNFFNKENFGPKNFKYNSHLERIPPEIS